jgi:L,D-peptidoglycan transpeptidase YkuD (ErfK/YbiS/YcfS/YnhG family)
MPRELLAHLSADGTLRFRGVEYRAALGAAGITSTKQEGDSATPAAAMTLRRVLYRADRVARPRAAVPAEPLAPQDGWCDDPADPGYNRMVRLPYAGRHEDLWRVDHLYDVIGVLGWNDDPVVRGRGSAIFLHVARPDFAPTEGCVALPLPELLALLASGCLGINATPR